MIRYIVSLALLLTCTLAAHAEEPVNIALGKLVTSNVPESDGYARKACRLTDGNLETDAYPGAFTLDYTVELTRHAEGSTKTDADGFDVTSLVIDWGKYGRHFPGVKQADGSWSPAAYKADYVNWYRIDYTTKANGDWQKLHERNGRPTDEDADGVKVERTPENASSSEGEVRTTLKNIDLRNITKLRIRARGGHWIGIHELSVYGKKR